MFLGEKRCKQHGSSDAACLRAVRCQTDEGLEEALLTWIPQHAKMTATLAEHTNAQPAVEENNETNDYRSVIFLFLAGSTGFPRLRRQHQHQKPQRILLLGNVEGGKARLLTL